MFIIFVNPDLRVDIIFRKEETAENGDIYFEIGDIGTSAHLYWRLTKFHVEPVCFFIAFLVAKDSFYKPLSSVLSYVHYLVL